ncbi:hypothetical protein TIFTF001_009831 [Ficus carica]|uniref:Uncharacterized protein n=1 Tax=Ficus carica TaxID=3494 RepID=A0AA88CZA0_FICCA|nr:hypothetical protein TIFTF001_009831 [Ficus carica]
MMEVRNERLSQLPEGSQLDSDDEEDIYSQVLVNEKNEKYGFKRGTGPMMKKRQLSSSGGSTQRLLVDNLRIEVADHKQRVADMEDRMKLQDERMKKQDELIQQLLQQLNPPSNHPGLFFQRQNGLPPPPPQPPAIMS